jgi:hypothetical protein
MSKSPRCQRTLPVSIDSNYLIEMEARVRHYEVCPETVCGVHWREQDFSLTEKADGFAGSKRWK